jgi:agmatine/peptidylarginine deiminase
MKRLIAEFEEQNFTQIIFPHQETDWKPYLQEAEQCFVHIINAIAEFQKCLVICANKQEVQTFFQPHKNIYFVEYVTDDTWARDCSALSVCEDNKVMLYDFTFSAWGDKFEATKDNLLTSSLAHCYSCDVKKIAYVLEGGGIESNGEGTLLTTATCMFHTNRNHSLTQEQRDLHVRTFFGANEILYLHHGYLVGDDTDAHIDTLARFISKDTIMYVTCKDTNDEHYEALYKMQEELFAFAATHNYKLIALPMCSPLYFKEERLPATYANFLFVNGGVLVPVYGVQEDDEALKIFQQTFPHRRIVPIDCSVLVRQHGSLHCVTMQFAKGIALQTC